MKIAFYKGTSKPFNWIVSKWTRGPYSHCEVIFKNGHCASSSFRDGGVRIKTIILDPERWDLMEISNIDESVVRAWFGAHYGQKYDILGLAAVLTPVKEDKDRWFCNEAIGAAMGVKDSWRFTPNSFASLCEAMGGKWIKE